MLGLLRDRIAAAPPATGPATALLIADPKDAVGFGAAEAPWMGEAFVRGGARALRGRGPSWLRTVAPEGDEVVVCAHGAFDPEDVYRSTIDLGAPSDRLPLAAFYGGALGLKPGASVLLSSCETSKSDTRLSADEHRGFPVGFLLASARFVGASLWSMSALASFMFGIEYVDCRLSGRDRAGSVRHAAEALRCMTRDELVSRLRNVCRRTGRRADLRRELQAAADQAAVGPELPFAHPVHWACFAANGI